MELTRDPDVRRAHSRDASGIELVPEAVARAEDVRDIVDVIRAAASTGAGVTAAGSQTSMTAASITDTGILLSLSAMKRVIDVDTERSFARVEPGITIGELNREIATTGLMFAPDPTSENDATIGGAIACNASGARSLFYGPTRNHVLGVTVVHADGNEVAYRRPGIEKNTVGYSAAQDPVDWFIGSEGTLGVVSEAVLSLVPAPLAIFGLAIPFASETDALAFVVSARAGSRTAGHPSARCLELFDAEALRIAGGASDRAWGDAAGAMIYLEDDAGAGADEHDLLSAWLELAEKAHAIAADIRVYQGAQALRDARVMRHAVPAMMNERGAAHFKSGGRKVSTDWAVPFERLAEALAFSRETIARHGAPLPVTYGHAGNGHPHQNFIARDTEELRRIYLAVEETLHHVVSMGGTVSAEHGLGKLKRGWLSMQLVPQQVAMMRAVKDALDPAGMFAPGNIL